MLKISETIVRSLRTSGAAGGGRRMNTWQSVRAHVLDRIRSREWPPGELIPTEQELATSLGCARATVNRALRELADSGIIERRRKVGTRVATTLARRTILDMPAIRTEIEDMGAAYDYALLAFARREPPEDAARALQLPGGEEALAVTAIHRADGNPHCIETSWLVLGALPAVTRGELERQSAQEWLSDRIALTHGQFSIMAGQAEADEADRLRVGHGTPVLVIERTTWADTTPVFFARQLFPPEHRLMSGD